MKPLMPPPSCLSKLRISPRSFQRLPRQLSLSSLPYVSYFSRSVRPGSFSANAINLGKRAPAPIVASVSVTSCRLESFDDGDRAVPPKPNQEPADCLNTLITRLLKDHASFIVLVGHSDLRELRPKSHRLLGDNGNLAYQRGQSVKNLLISRYAAASASASGVGSKTSLPAIIVLNAGASQGGDARAHPADLGTDRAVEILSFWTDIPS